MSPLLRFSLLVIGTFVAASTVAGGRARAACSPAIRYSHVGDTGRDARCNYASIQDAIDHATCPTTIVIASRASGYTSQRLQIANKSVVLIGSTAGCGTQVCSNPNGCGAAPAQVALRGAGPVAGSIFSITGNSHVSLANLELTGAVGAANGGGAIDFTGSGSLSLTNTDIHGNRGDMGGGIYMHPATGSAELGVGNDVIISDNSASGSGGGIAIEGAAHLTLSGDRSGLLLNDAGWSGGGLSVSLSASADISSPGFGGTLGAIYGNSAVHGGGIAIWSGVPQTLVRLFSTDPARPVQVNANTASGDGGAIYAQVFPQSVAKLCANDYRLDSNSASEGTAVYAAKDTSGGDGDVGGGVIFGLRRATGAPVDECADETLAALGAVHCASGVACNEVASNVAKDLNGDATAGSTIFSGLGTQLALSRLSLRANRGGHLLTGSRIALDDCLSAGNTVTGELMLLRSPDVATPNVIDGCTFARDTIGSPYVFGYSGALTLRNTIFGELPSRALSATAAGAVAQIDYVLADDITTLATGNDVVAGNAQFVDPAHGDYHLGPLSPALDFAPAETGYDIDIERQPRNVDLSGIPNRSGPRDLGAYERQAN